MPRPHLRVGDLPSALVDAGLEQLAAAGPAGFSVAEVARRVGVSTAAPYRHVADRDGFLAAVAARGARLLTEAVGEAVEAAGGDARERLAAAAGAYTAVVAERRVGFDAIFSPALRAVHDRELAEAGRDLMALFLDAAREIAGEGALRLAEQVVVLAHGYATLGADGVLTTDRVTDEPTPERARRAARALIDGARVTLPVTGDTGPRRSPTDGRPGCRC